MNPKKVAKHSKKAVGSKRAKHSQPAFDTHPSPVWQSGVGQEGFGPEVLNPLEPQWNTSERELREENATPEESEHVRERGRRFELMSRYEDAGKAPVLVTIVDLAVEVEATVDASLATWRAADAEQHFLAAEVVPLLRRYLGDAPFAAAELRSFIINLNRGDEKAGQVRAGLVLLLVRTLLGTTPNFAPLASLDGYVALLQGKATAAGEGNVGQRGRGALDDVRASFLALSREEQAAFVKEATSAFGAAAAAGRGIDDWSERYIPASSPMAMQELMVAILHEQKHLSEKREDRRQTVAKINKAMQQMGLKFEVGGEQCALNLGGAGRGVVQFKVGRGRSIGRFDGPKATPFRLVEAAPQKVRQLDRLPTPS